MPDDLLSASPTVRDAVKTSLPVPGTRTTASVPASVVSDGDEHDACELDDGHVGVADASGLTPGGVRELADVVRTAKGHLSRARSSTAKLAQSAADLAKTLDLVDATSAALASANRELQSELSSMSNGGPPLNDAKRASHPP